MIDYETFCRIKHLHAEDGLNVTQIAQSMALDPRTVQGWLATQRYRPRQGTRRGSKLGDYKATVRRLIERHPYSGVQVFQRLKEAGYTGSLTVVKGRSSTSAARCPRRSWSTTSIPQVPAGFRQPGCRSSRKYAQVAFTGVLPSAIIVLATTDSHTANGRAIGGQARQRAEQTGALP